MITSTRQSRAPRDAYARVALAQVPRLLTLQDRNPYSPTYGCFHRDYWLYKTSDFPDAVRQFAMQALALVYAHPLPGSIYYREPKILEWALAGLDYWTRVQHSDGSFDEFYPYERGWVGPTAFTTFTAIETLLTLGEAVPAAAAARARQAIRRAARMIATGESEEDHLANHHAMAYLTLWKAHHLLGDADLKEASDRAWATFLTYHESREGWSREYDGVDPGYLSATVSFLGKVYKESRDARLRPVLEQSVHFSSYFVYPNGAFAGSLGSRNTLHFYPHGFEVLAGELPEAAAVAEKMLAALDEGKLVPPAIMSDRYVAYRVPEMLQSYLDYGGRPAALPPVPYEQAGLREYFPLARVDVRTSEQAYVVSNLAKGGVIKVFDTATGRLRHNDCGLIGHLQDGRTVTTQWVDPGHACESTAQGWRVEGLFNVVPSNKLFTLQKGIVFRIVLACLGWNSAFSHRLKGMIRRTLMIGTRSVPIRFVRTVTIDPESAVVETEVRIEGDVAVTGLREGDEFFVRYVPQSRFFQAQELDVTGRELTAEELATLSRDRRLVLTTRVPLAAHRVAEN